MHNQNRPYSGVVLKLKVDIGKCKKVGKNDPMMKTWHENGYDSVWSPAGANGKRGEHCVRDPARVQIVDMYLGHDVKASDAGYRVVREEVDEPVWEYKTCGHGLSSLWSTVRANARCLCV